MPYRLRPRKMETCAHCGKVFPDVESHIIRGEPYCSECYEIYKPHPEQGAKKGHLFRPRHTSPEDLRAERRAIYEQREEIEKMRQERARRLEGK